MSVRTKRCIHLGCTTVPPNDQAVGTRELCAQHSEDGVVSVRSRKCSHPGCIKLPSYAQAGGEAERRAKPNTRRTG